MTVLALGLLAGYELYDRLLRGSAPALALVLAVSGLLGAYGGWLLAVVVFAAVRGSGDEEGRPSPQG